MTKIAQLLQGFALLCLLVSCSSVYYDTMEKFGVHKRDILIDRVVEANDAQEEAKQQFSSALEQFNSVVNFDGGELQDSYESLNTALEESEARAKAVTDRIAAVEDVSEALFDEWEAELDQYSNPKLKTASERQLRSTRGRYNKMMLAMRSAEGKMDPVLSAFRDQVLFLKHNLNAQAIISLKSEFKSIKSDIRVLIKDMEASIAESNKFVEQLRQS
jgi:hypothetical protein